MVSTLTIALTGGIGSGKSFIASIFEDLGVPIIDSDIISREIILPGKPCFTKIVNKFGKGILTKEGVIDRGALQNIIFDDDKARIELENITHPVILKNIGKQIMLINYPYCLVIVPLLIEKKWIKYFDKILLVDALESVQFQRVIKRDNMSPELLKKIISTQASRSERLKYADNIIENNSDIKNLYKIVNSLNEKYLEIGN